MRVRPHLVIVIAVLLIAGSLPVGVHAVGPRSAPHGGAGASTTSHSATEPKAAAVKPRRSIARLDDAVTAGVLDKAVLTALRASGRAQATIAFDSKSIVDEATVEVGAADAKLKQRLALIDTNLVKQRGRVLGGAGKGIAIDHAYAYLDVVDVTITSASALLKLVRDREVEGVVAPRLAEPHMSQSLPIIGQPTVKAQGHEGQGTYVAVLDTGVSPTANPSYFPANSIYLSTDVAPNDSSADQGGHGSHVSSTILGVAPKTKLLVYDVFQIAAWNNCRADEGTTCNRSDPSWQKAAITNVLSRKAGGLNIVALNMSLGGGWYNTLCTDDMSFGMLRTAGILPVISAGNDYTVVQNGVSVVKTGIGWPGCIPQAVTVGATNDNSSRALGWACDYSTGVDTIAGFSQTTTATHSTYGPQLDIRAPGACIQAAGGNWQGTSMAAPHVAGAVAVVQGSYPFAASAAGTLALEQHLEATGKTITDTRQLAGNLARPRLNLLAAIQGRQGTVDTTAPVVGNVSVEMLNNQMTLAGAVTARIRWNATDPAGVKSYTFWWRQNGGAWTQQALANPLTTSWDYVLSPGVLWEFAVNATDSRNNVSEFKLSLPSRFTVIQENHASIVYSPLANWTRVARTDCLGGNMTYGSVYGSQATFTFTNARQAAWVATMGPDRGYTFRWLDDRELGWQDLADTTQRRRIPVAVFNIANYSATHTIRLWLHGTSGRPLGDVDAFVLLQSS